MRQQCSRARENVAWLAERPTRFGGEWGLGCTVCAWFANRAFSEQRGSEGSCGSSTSQPQRGKASLCRLGSRFARFEVRAEYLQAEHFKQHAESSAHRRAVIAWLNPDAPLRFAAQATLGDEQLLSGAVPPTSRLAANMAGVHHSAVVAGGSATPRNRTLRAHVAGATCATTRLTTHGTDSSGSGPRDV